MKNLRPRDTALGIYSSPATCIRRPRTLPQIPSENRAEHPSPTSIARHRRKPDRPPTVATFPAGPRFFRPTRMCGQGCRECTYVHTNVSHVTKISLGRWSSSRTTHTRVSTYPLPAAARRAQKCACIFSRKTPCPLGWRPRSHMVREPPAGPTHAPRAHPLALPSSTYRYLRLPTRGDAAEKKLPVPPPPESYRV